MLDLIHTLTLNSDLFNAIYSLIALNFILQICFNEYIKNDNYQVYFLFTILIFDISVLTYFNI